MNEILVVDQPAGALGVTTQSAGALSTTEVAGQLVVIDESGVTQVMVATAPGAALISVEPVVSQTMVAEEPVGTLLVGVEALEILEAMGSDNIISAAEKKTLVPLMQQLFTEAAGYIASADAIGIDSSAYADAVTALNDYITSLTTPVAWNDTSGITTVNGVTLQAYADAVYTTRTNIQAALQSITYRQTTEPTGGTYSLADRWLQTGIPVPILYGWSGTAWQRIGAAGDLATQNLLKASYSDLSTGANLISDECWADTDLDGTEPHYWEITDTPAVTITVETDGLGAAHIGASRSLRIPVVDPGTGAGGQVTVSAGHKLSVHPGETFRLILGTMGTDAIDTTSSLRLGCAATVRMVITGHDYLHSITSTLFDQTLTVNGNFRNGFNIVRPFFEAIFSTDPSGSISDADIDITVTYGGSVLGASAGFLRLGTPRVFRITGDGEMLHATDIPKISGTEVDLASVMAPTATGISGSTIAYFGDPGGYSGQQRFVNLGSGLTLAHSAYMVLPNGADIVCEDGDVAWFYWNYGEYDAGFGGSGNAIWRMRAYFRASGKALTPPTLADIEGSVGLVTHGTATAGQTTFDLNRAMNPGDEPNVLVWVGGSPQDASQYTFNGTTTATLGFAMAAGDAWRAINLG